ncbi:MAG: outer membrane lipoprotein-sorting protein [Opitutaceae bacterium]
MADSGRFAPAPKWRAFFVFGVLAAQAFAAVPVTAPDLAQLGRPTPAQAREIIEHYQQAGISGEYYLEFELKVLPRRGEERTLRGKLWGGRNAQGAITRIAVVDSAGRESRFLLQNGARAAAWTFVDGRLGQLAGDAWFAPLVAGVEIAPFDLQMPFFYWPDFTVENLVRKNSRPTQVFFFRPPAEFTKQPAAISGVRAYLDTQFNAPVQTELMGTDGRLLKTLSLFEVKKVGNQALPKIIDVRNDVTRDKTRFQVTGAALGLELPPSVFQPATLAEEVRPPPAERIIRIDR